MRQILHRARQANNDAVQSGRSFPEIDPHWQDYLERLGRLLDGVPRSDFLRDPMICRSMVRSPRADSDEIELNTVVKALRRRFFQSEVIETSVGCPRLHHQARRLSNSTLGHAWMAVRLHEQFGDAAFDEIVELGGGYGNFARLMLSHQPAASYVIVDFPEVLAVQHLFLTLALPDLSISLDDGTSTRPPSTVTLLPVGCAGELHAAGRRTLFTSQSALNESGKQTIYGVRQRKFFGANHCWIALPKQGFESWGQPEEYIRDALHATFPRVSSLPTARAKSIVLIGRK